MGWGHAVLLIVKVRIFIILIQYNLTITSFQNVALLESIMTMMPVYVAVVDTVFISQRKDHSLVKFVALGKRHEQMKLCRPKNALMNVAMDCNWHLTGNVNHVLVVPIEHKEFSLLVKDVHLAERPRKLVR